jgi:hypothetical protein
LREREINRGRADGGTIVKRAWAAILVTLLSSGTARAEDDATIPLRTRNGFFEMFHAENVQLGTFAVDLGLPNEGDRLSIQSSLALADVFGGVVEGQLERTSHGDCNLFLTTVLYPYLEGFMYRSDDAEPSEKARPFCFRLLKQVLSAARFGDSLIRQQVAEHERYAQDYTAADAKRTGVPVELDEVLAIRDALRAIYDERSTVHALLSVRLQQLTSITPDSFRDWVEQVRKSGRIRLLTEDEALQRDLGLPEQDRHASLPPMQMQKTSADVIELSEIHRFRAAVMVAIDTPSGIKVTNEAVEKYCARTRSDLVNHVRNLCSFEVIFERETWICFFFPVDAIPDDQLSDAVARIATDPAVVVLAAGKHEGSRTGKPYIVWFGRRQPQ